MSPTNLWCAALSTIFLIGHFNTRHQFRFARPIQISPPVMIVPLLRQLVKTTDCQSALSRHDEMLIFSIIQYVSSIHHKNNIIAQRNQAYHSIDAYLPYSRTRRPIKTTYRFHCFVVLVAAADEMSTRRQPRLDFSVSCAAQIGINDSIQIFETIRRVVSIDRPRLTCLALTLDAWLTPSSYQTHFSCNNRREAATNISFNMFEHTDDNNNQQYRNSIVSANTRYVELN